MKIITTVCPVCGTAKQSILGYDPIEDIRYVKPKCEHGISGMLVIGTKGGGGHDCWISTWSQLNSEECFIRAQDPRNFITLNAYNGFVKRGE